MRWESGSSYRQQVTGQEDMVSRHIKGDLDWTLGKISGRVVRHWDSLPRGVMESQSLDMLQTGVEVALEDVVQQ